MEPLRMILSYFDILAKRYTDIVVNVLGRGVDKHRCSREDKGTSRGANVSLLNSELWRENFLDICKMILRAIFADSARILRAVFDAELG